MEGNRKARWDLFILSPKPFLFFSYFFFFFFFERERERLPRRGGDILIFSENI